MELLQLKYFRDAAITENFSQVAEKYYVPQSSISHTISRLEDEIGAKLFTRNGKKVRLNEAGKAFYEEIDAALAKIEKGIRQVNNMKHNTVRLSMLQGTVAMIPLISDFQKKNPDIEITFVNPSDKLKGNLFFDLRVATKPSESEKNCTAAPLFEERILTAIPASHPLAKKKSITINDIRGIPVIGLYPGSGMYNLMNGYFARNEYAPEIKVESENHTTVAQFVKEGYGIAFYPEISWSAVGTEGIVSLPFADFDFKRTVYMFYPNDYEPSDATKKFMKFAKDWFKNNEK